MNTFPFIPGLTWRKAGFAFLSSSLAYREVIEANPGWDITAEPPPGSLLNSPETMVTRGLNQVARSSGLPYSNKDPMSYYPYDSWDEYVKSLVRYPPSALKNVEQCNGWSSTSDDVLYDKKYNPNM